MNMDNHQWLPKLIKKKLIKTITDESDFPKA